MGLLSTPRNTLTPQPYLYPFTLTFIFASPADRSFPSLHASFLSSLNSLADRTFLPLPFQHQPDRLLVTCDLLKTFAEFTPLSCFLPPRHSSLTPFFFFLFYLHSRLLTTSRASIRHNRFISNETDCPLPLSQPESRGYGTFKPQKRKRNAYRNEVLASQHINTLLSFRL